MDNDWTRAIAYIKQKEPEDGTACVSLSREDSPVLRDLGNGLLVSYVIDEGKSLSYIQQRDLFEAGIDENQLHRSAIKNLFGLASKHLRFQPAGNAFAVFMENNFEASVLLLDTVWDLSLAKYVHEEFIAAIPARDVLAFADSSSAVGIAELRGIVERVVNNPRADHLLSTSLYRRRGRTWVPF